MHPSPEILADFLHGRLSGREQQMLESHVAECDSCCEVLRCVPDDPLVQRLRCVETPLPGETLTQFAPPGNIEQTPAAIPPELIDHPRYRIERQLGSGGMGVVYQAEHRLMERPVALKVINQRLLSNPLAVERFHHEVKAAARLAHRNIVTAHDAEQAGNVHFLVMEFVEGISLAELVRRRGPLPVLHACNFIMQAASGLAHAHEHGMVHRDIKPQNLMRTPKGAIKILDFGLARFASQQQADAPASGLTMDGATVGTPDFIAPEQARDSRKADIRADIYSLGCTFYYLLTGRVPFPTGTAIEKFIAHSEHEPTPLAELRGDIPPEVTAIVQRMMAKDREQRFQTPTEVVEALKPFGKPGASPVEPASAGSTPTSAAETVEPVLQPTYVELPPLPPLPLRRRRKDWRKSFSGYRTPLLAAVAALSLFTGVVFLASSLGNRPTSSQSEELPPAASNGWIDLLTRLDPTDFAIAGQWQKLGGELHVDAAQGARLVLPWKPPREYDFEVQFTRNTGRYSVALIFVDGSGQASLEFDAWGQQLAGIQSIRGETLQQQARPARIGLANGSRTTALIKVRRDRVETYVDGKPLYKYEGDGSDLSLLKLWQLPNSQAIGVGAFNSDTTFHRIRIRPIRP